MNKISKDDERIKTDYLSTSRSSLASKTIDFSKINKNKIEEYIELMQEHQMNCVKVGNFIEAELAKQRVIQLKKIQEKAGSEDYRNTSGIMRETFVKVVNDDVTPILKDIKTPTLLVFGEKDESTPVSKGKMMEKLMSDATLVIFENDDHFAYFNEGDRFNRVLEAYLKEDYE